MIMKKLLSLPADIAASFHDVEPRYRRGEWFSTSDPADRKLGSGAGTVWLLDRWAESLDSPAEAHDRKIIIHAGGQSRRLPAYAAVGKSLAPMPVLRWATGQSLDLNLLGLQMPLLTEVMERAPERLRTLVASGDVCLTSDGPLAQLPDADVVCFGIWASPQQASRHGVFVLRRSDPSALDFMLQKPDADRLAALAVTHLYLMDTGLWVLSDRAVELLRRKSVTPSGDYRFYDLYTQFGGALGLNPSQPDPEIGGLTVAIVPLDRGRFYHFGTTRELISSTLAMQNVVADQRLLSVRSAKPNPALFVQNCLMDTPLTAANNNIWVENSHVGPHWTMTSDNVITGVPRNDWTISLPQGACIDIVPVGDAADCVRPYGFDDPMRGAVTDPSTLYLGRPLAEWAAARGLDLGDLCDDSGVDTDIYFARLFPVTESVEEAGLLARWMISEPELEGVARLWQSLPRLSADGISRSTAIGRLYARRRAFLRADIPVLARNCSRSVFYNLDLEHTASLMHSMGLPAPAPLDADAPSARRMRNFELRSRVARLAGADGSADDAEAFGIMRRDMLDALDSSRSLPQCDVMTDQIVWGRSPVRIDLAGGWTDTAPASLWNGGRVVNAAVELNSLPPLQVFVRRSPDMAITLRSIDLGAEERIDDFRGLSDFHRVGSPFSLPKAALCLAGFYPAFCQQRFDSLESQLKAFGSGLDLTLLSAVPAGSGLGTSSILGATVLGALANFCSLAWDTTDICSRTVALEQMLTTGGGWQDQYGGMLPGLKLLTTGAGALQRPVADWLPQALFTDPQYSGCHLLYYIGLTRTAKDILAEIVRRMMLNDRRTLDILDEMRLHAAATARDIQRCDFTAYGRDVLRSWDLNKRIDSGTNPPAVQAIIDRIADYALGYKLPGAGGGGFLYIVAKDPDAAVRIRHILTSAPPNPRARFCEMSLSATGLKISRS